MLKDTVFPPPPFPSPPLLDNIASYSSNNTLYCPQAGILTYIWWFRNLAPGGRVEVLFQVKWIVGMHCNADQYPGTTSTSHVQYIILKKYFFSLKFSALFGIILAIFASRIRIFVLHAYLDPEGLP